MTELDYMIEKVDERCDKLHLEYEQCCHIRDWLYELKEMREKGRNDE